MAAAAAPAAAIITTFERFFGGAAPAVLGFAVPATTPGVAGVNPDRSDSPRAPADRNCGTIAAIAGATGISATPRLMPEAPGRPMPEELGPLRFRPERLAAAVSSDASVSAISCMLGRWSGFFATMRWKRASSIGGASGRMPRSTGTGCSAMSQDFFDHRLAGVHRLGGEQTIQRAAQAIRRSWRRRGGC